jgi:hypothetical protein
VISTNTLKLDSFERWHTRAPLGSKNGAIPNANVSANAARGLLYGSGFAPPINDAYAPLARVPFSSHSLARIDLREPRMRHYIQRIPQKTTQCEKKPCEQVWDRV